MAPLPDLSFFDFLKGYYLLLFFEVFEAFKVRLMKNDVGKRSVGIVFII
jgi:hypothetical protein